MLNSPEKMSDSWGHLDAAQDVSIFEFFRGVVVSVVVGFWRG